MHIHILGACGTFMGGIAALAAAAGHRVTGCDENVYPPMSTQLRDLGIELVEGFDAGQLEPAPDCVVVGNVMRRGMPVIEALLESAIPFCSGPEWLSDHVLRGRHVFAVAGTHGKTTTASMLAWILEAAGKQPGFLIGGIPTNFDTSARYGGEDYFVVEADEYDTAFFDKRAKFVHYRPATVLLNNIEFDHADIYRDIDAILWQFHQLLRIVPANGRVIGRHGDGNIEKLLGMGCWTPVETFGVEDEANWRGRYADAGERKICITGPDGAEYRARWQLGGRHNLENAIAAVAAARSAGIGVEDAVAALARFEGVKRRMERTATVADIGIYDDFAHHPTAIRHTISAVRRRHPGRRVLVAFEPRSNTMKMGVHNDTLAASLEDADMVWVYRPADAAATLDAALEPLGNRLRTFDDYDRLASAMSSAVQAGDQVVFMSNGGFGNARQTLTAILQRTRAGR
jgi:UDP-N-acetylmuramate: L-alanyl-gamma-D-glutamyl-meso-diaminopimelate ligase